MNGSFSLSKKSFAPQRVSNRILRQVAKFIKSQDMCLTFYTLRAKKFLVGELFCANFDRKRGSDRETVRKTLFFDSLKRPPLRRRALFVLLRLISLYFVGFFSGHAQRMHLRAGPSDGNGVICLQHVSVQRDLVPRLLILITVSLR